MIEWLSPRTKTIVLSWFFLVFISHKCAFRLKLTHFKSSVFFEGIIQKLSELLLLRMVMHGLWEGLPTLNFTLGDGLQKKYILTLTLLYHLLEPNREQEQNMSTLFKYY